MNKALHLHLRLGVFMMALLLGGTSAARAQTLYNSYSGFTVPTDPVLPAAEVHPSLMFAAADVPGLLAKKDQDAYAMTLWNRLFGTSSGAWYNKYKSSAATDFSDPAERSQFTKLMAFAWIMNGDAAARGKAIDGLLAAYANVPRTGASSSFDKPWDEIYRGTWLQNYVEAYDWVQPQLTPAQDAAIRDLLVEEVLLLRNNMVSGARYAPRPHNHRAKPAYGIASAALALSADPRAADWLRFGLEQVNTVTKYQYSADGIYREGGHYDMYSAVNFIPFLWQYLNVSGVNHFPYYQAAFEWPVLTRTGRGWIPNLEDSYLKVFPTHMVAAAYTGTSTRLHTSAPLSEVLQWHWFASTDFTNGKYTGASNDVVWEIDEYVLYHPEIAESAPDVDPLVHLATGQTVFRASWTDTQAPYLLFHGVAAADNHDHPDLLSYFVESRAAVLVPDAGYGPGGFSDDRRDSWYTTPEAHTTLTLGGAPLTNFLPADQNLGPKDVHFLQADSFALNEKQATAAGKSYENSISRGVAFIDGAFWVVYDRVATAAPEPVPIKMFLHGRGSLTRTGNTMKWVSPTDVYGFSAALHAFVLTSEDATLSESTGWTSFASGREESQRYVAVEQTADSALFMHLLYPSAPSESLPPITDLSGAGRLAFSLVENGIQHVFTLQGDSFVRTTGDMTTDAHFTSAKSDATGWWSLGFVEGSFVRWKGADVLQAERPVTLFVQRMALVPPGEPGGGTVYDWRVEVDSLAASTRLTIGLEGDGPVEDIRFNGEALAYEQQGRTLSVLLPGRGTLQFRHSRTTGTEPAARPGEPSFGLTTPYPNPSLGAARVSGMIDLPGLTTLSVYDVLGRRVAVLYDGFHPGGPIEAAWRGTDDAGQPLPGGLYLFRLQNARSTALTSAVLIR